MRRLITVPHRYTPTSALAGTLSASLPLHVVRRRVSATLAGTGLDLGSFRRCNEAGLPSRGLPSTPPTCDVPTADKASGAHSRGGKAGAALDKATTPVQRCVVRGRVERVRGHGKKMAFVHLRQPPGESVQVVCFGKALAAQAKAIPPESIVEVEGDMRPAEVVPIVSTTCAYHELHASEIRVVSAAATPLPFPIQDVNTKLDTRLNHRAMDLRTRLTSSVLRVVSAVCQSYRAALLELDFVEVHTPKLIAAASEGGSAVFEVKYFEASKAYLAQSPQLYKQMCLNGDAMRVFEIGPVFRAEQSLTHRHLTEFTGLDGEMVIHERYTEVLDVLEHVMCRVLRDLQDERKPYAALVKAATAALAERQPQQALPGEEGSAGPSTSLSDIAYELSPETISRYGIVSDAATATATATVQGECGEAKRRDPYNARVGGATLQVRAVGEEGAEEVRTLACPRVLRLFFDDAVRLLRDAKEAEDGIEDFTLPQERKLGELVKARYGVDLYVVDCWPTASRPFYTMPCQPIDATTTTASSASCLSSSPLLSGHRTRSYDMYLRGEEICSGAQRQHDAGKLTARLAELGLSLSPGDGLSDYVESFRYGAWPHGGFGLGLERIVAFFLGAQDIRQVSLFPRDPKRLTP